MSDTFLRKGKIPEVFDRLSFSSITIGSASLLLAELFYKLHSFTLELAAFLATCYLLDALVSTVRKRHLGVARERFYPEASTTDSGLRSMRCDDV